MTTFGRRGIATTAATTLSSPPPEPAAVAPQADADDLQRILYERDTELDDELTRWKAARRKRGWATSGRWRELAALAALCAALAELFLHGPYVWMVSTALGGAGTVFGIVSWTRPKA